MNAALETIVGGLILAGGVAVTAMTGPEQVNQILYAKNPLTAAKEGAILAGYTVGYATLLSFGACNLVNGVKHVIAGK